MTKKTKIFIGIGVLAAVAAGVYFYKKKTTENSEVKSIPAKKDFTKPKSKPKEMASEMPKKKRYLRTA